MDFRNDLLTFYFSVGLKYKEITYILEKDHDISLSLRQVKRILQKLHLSRRTYNSTQEAVNFIESQLESSGQLHGYRMMWSRCRENGLNVRMNDVRLILKYLDPVGSALRTARRFRCREYYASGPNFIWLLDGYDKLKPFGLCISGCICGFSRTIIWLNVYKTNNDPRVIGGYFLEAVEKHGGCPRIVRGDYGTENGHVAAFQNFLWRNNVENPKPYIEGTSTSNQRIESWWGYLRREHMHFWIELLKYMQDIGKYSGDFLDKNLVRFCFLPLIQTELDLAKDMWNHHSNRVSKNSGVPSGRPIMMYTVPSLWNSLDYLCLVSREDFAACREEAEFRSSIPCDKDVYDLCISVMHDAGFEPARNAQEARDLYMYLRSEIIALM